MELVLCASRAEVAVSGAVVMLLPFAPGDCLASMPCIAAAYRTVNLFANIAVTSSAVSGVGKACHGIEGETSDRRPGIAQSFDNDGHHPELRPACIDDRLKLTVPRGTLRARMLGVLSVQQESSVRRMHAV